MADYYTLLSRAVTALPENTPSARKLVYDRAKAALTSYLLKLDPPATPESLAAETESIDAAIRRLELEYFNPLEQSAEAAQSDAVKVEASPAVSGAQVQSRPTIPLEIKRPTASRPAEARSGRKWKLAAGVGAIALMAGIGAAALYLPNHPFDQKKPTPGVQNEAAAAPADAPKIVERVNGANADKSTLQAPASAPASQAPAPSSTASASPGVAVAQRAALLVQLANPDKTKGEPLQQKAFVGDVVWHLVDISGGPGQPLQKAVRADVHVPDAHVDMTMIIQKNLDAALPASHTIQIDFTLGADSVMKSVDAISMPELRDESAPTGSELLGAPAAITSDHFIVALAQGQTAETQNLELLKARPWVDIPLITSDHLLAKITIEKGADGDAAISGALKSWNQ
ncbi:MAG: hypothetical protein KGQ46_04915 [Hyphomicrobiales bacterium]|nr:hypothetical protein [Hyphomicrobiales bacterium]MDE2116112.1 hypothetical protein [Hyphomicrobiales bacterium]